MVPRICEKLLKRYARGFRAVAIAGPRQSGKTILVRNTFPDKPYISLENPDERLMAENDARTFLSRFPKGAIIDEIQRAPALFSYLQQILDETKRDGLFILTGSNNFLLQESLTQTLAGRAGYIDLLPLSYSEIELFGKKQRTTDSLMLLGAYPEIYHRKRKPAEWYPAYIRTFVERDVKQFRNVGDTILFQRFMQLCAGRTGQLLNVASISNECDIDVKTVNAWLGLLQAAYIIHLLPPYHKSFNKRIVKTPKLYFIDTGLACNLLGIRTPLELSNSHFRGSLFENLVVTELLKKKFNSGSPSRLYFWRDNKGLEVDVLWDSGKQIVPIEIKSSRTLQPDHMRYMKRWNKISGSKQGILVYDGDQEFLGSDGIKVVNWKKIGELELK